LLPVVAPGGAQPADIRVTTRVGADSVTVGERFRIAYEAVFADSFVLVPPAAETLDLGTCRLMKLDWKEKTSQGRTVKTAFLEVITIDLDVAYVPGTALVFYSPGGDTTVVYTDDVAVPVRHLIDAPDAAGGADDVAGAGAAGEPKPLKPQWQAPRSYLNWFIIAAAVVLAAIALYLWRRYRKREVIETPKPVLPADFVALRRLDEIERMNLPDAGEFKRYYTLVVDALRKYLENRYGVMAMDRTTDEILWDLRRIRVEVEGLEPMLNEADLVKFAKHRPDVVAAKKLMEMTRAIVARTAVRPKLTAISGE
jgi:hypothetical protein